LARRAPEVIKAQLAIKAHRVLQDLVALEADRALGI
jgi:hypothetical protein